MATKDVVLVFTRKTVNRILQDGGSKSWRLRPDKTLRCKYVVCTRNTKGSEGTEEHRAAFLVGKVKDVVPLPEYPGRFLIRFTEYAEVKEREVWPEKIRNPVHYDYQEKVRRIDFRTLKFKPMPGHTRSDRLDKSSHHTTLTLQEAKDMLAMTFGVSPEAIQITIHA
jgi:hypothetical protein